MDCFLLEDPLKEISLRPVLSSPTPFKIQRGSPERDEGRTEILVSNIGYPQFQVYETVQCSVLLLWRKAHHTSKTNTEHTLYIVCNNSTHGKAQHTDLGCALALCKHSTSSGEVHIANTHRSWHYFFHIVYRIISIVLNLTLFTLLIYVILLDVLSFAVSWSS